MMEEKENKGGHKKHYEDQPEIYANAVRAGKRTYFFDVRATRAGEHYLTMTESKRRYSDDGTYVYQKHKIFLYKEDFEKFTDALTDAVKKIIELNAERDSSTAEKVEKSFSDVNFEDLGGKDNNEASTETTNEPAASDAPAEETTSETAAEETVAEETTSETTAEETPAEETAEAPAESTETTESKDELSFEEMTSADLMGEPAPAEEKKEE